MHKNYIEVHDLVDKFHLDVVANKKATTNKISFVTISRIGLELSGNFVYDEIKTLVYFGTKESLYLKTLNETARRKSIEGIFKAEPPAILLGKNFKYIDEIIQLAKKYEKVPIIKTDFNYNDIYFTLTNHMTHVMAKYEIFHGTLLEIFGVGTLIIGKPGIGKTEVAVELIRRGHIFVGDDAIDIARIGSVIRARANELTKGFIEVRGLGLLNFNKIFGYHKMIDSTQIQVVIELVDGLNKKEQYERVGKTHYKNILHIKIPYYKIPIAAGRKMSEIIECAISQFKLKKQGYDSVADLKQRIDKVRKT